jgi:glutathione peroxidase
MMRYALLASVLVAVLFGAMVLVRGFFGSVVRAQSTRPGGEAAVKTTALSHTLKDIDGKDLDLASLKGKVVLVVNVASKCGFTKQYTGLEALYQKYKDQGLVIVGLPSNDFGGQEPGSEEEIKTFCSTTYGVTFPMTAKVTVKGPDKHPVYKALTDGTGPFAGEVKWNFTKFLIGRDGETLVGRFASGVKPEDPKLVGAVEAALAR